MTIEGALNDIRDTLLTLGNPDIGKVDPYVEMRNRLHLCTERFTQWREYFRTYSDALSQDIAELFNTYRTLGHFESSELNPTVLKYAFEHPEKVFDRHI